mgnify:CR=1 FL=1
MSSCGEFERFQKSFYDSADKVVFRDDRGLKDDQESEAFYQAHFSQWKSKSYNNFCVWFASILKDIVNKGGYNLSWLPVEYILFNDIEEDASMSSCGRDINSTFSSGLNAEKSIA